MTNNRLFLHVALVASTIGCAKAKLPEQQYSQSFCPQQKHITASSPWTQDWEGCVEGWRTLAGVPVSSMLVTDATSPAKPHVQTLSQDIRLNVSRPGGAARF